MPQREYVVKFIKDGEYIAEIDHGMFPSYSLKNQLIKKYEIVTILTTEESPQQIRNKIGMSLPTAKFDDLLLWPFEGYLLLGRYLKGAFSIKGTIEPEDPLIFSSPEGFYKLLVSEIDDKVSVLKNQHGFELQIDISSFTVSLPGGKKLFHDNLVTMGKNVEIIFREKTIEQTTWNDS